ncbi:latexin-like isoform 2-T2 [Discoglossus pictus]
MEELNPSHYPATRAVTVAKYYMNYKWGTPHRWFEGTEVMKASRETIAGVGNKYYLSFTTKYNSSDDAIDCTAEVIYPEKHTAPEVSLKFSRDPPSHIDEKDQEFYNKLRSLKEPLSGQDIPDKFGHVEPEMEPLWHLAHIACEYVKWQHSTEDTLYAMTIIKSFSQVKRTDEALGFHFDLLIHDMISQEIIPCQIDLSWDPKGGLKIEKQALLPK